MPARSSSSYVVAVFGDTHCGSMLGLCPPRVRLDDGGNYEPSKMQRWLWERFHHYAAQIKALVKQENARLLCVSMGDAVEGDHHGTTQIISRNLEAQNFVLHATFDVFRKLEPDAWFVIRGTEAHVGPSAAHEESLGRWLNAQQEPDNHTWSWWDLNLELNGYLFNFKHHGSVGGMPHTKGNAPRARAMTIAENALLLGHRVPDAAFRAHAHTFVDTHDELAVRLVQTLPWQFKTAHGWKVATDKIMQVGGHALIVRPDGWDIKHFKYQPEVPAPWSPSLLQKS